MKLSRRKLFELSLGAGQLALLSRFGIREARAQSTFRPSKLLAIHLDGGCHWETFFAPFTAAGVSKYMPLPQGGIIPFGYAPAQVENFDRTPVDLNAPGPVRKWRGPIFWNWNSPGDTTGPVPNSNGGHQFRPYGYAWADPAFKLYERAAVLIGADQGTASHYSGIVASLCGVAGSNFRAPAVQAVVAAAMQKRFPDRPLPNVSISGVTPSSADLPSFAAPTRVTTDASVVPTLSDKRDSAWLGLRARTPTTLSSFSGSSDAGTAPLTATDAYALNAVKSRGGKSSPGTDALLQSLYDTYAGASRTIGRDIAGSLATVRGFERLAAQEPTRYPLNWTSCIGYADSCGSFASMGAYDFAVKLLKSELVTSVTLRATSFNNFAFDTHTSNGPQIHTNHLRIALEGVARTLLEMSLTPSLTPGKSLLDETVVYVFSDFGRTFPKRGSDHHPATCAIVAGGTIIGNQMVGGYDETNDSSPMGVPVPVVEETGSRVTRTVNSQDIAATVLHAFGLEMGRDFFIPGGYGVFDGVIG